MDFLLPVVAYLLGSISSAVIVSRILRLPDPRDHGSKNSGATNILRLGGKKAALITLVGDCLKGVLPIVIAMLLSETATVIALVGLCSFLGHLYPIFFAFKGGKGVATAAGVFIGLDITIAAWLIALWLVMVLISRYSSLSALTAAAFAPLIVYLYFGMSAYTAMTLVIAILLFWRHRANIERLLNKQESKIRLKKTS